MKNLLLQVSRNVMLHIKVGNTKPKHTCDALSRNNLFWVEWADIPCLAICKMTYETINFLKLFCWQWQIHLSKSNISRSFLDTKWHIQIDFTDETLQTVSNFWKRSSTAYLSDTHFPNTEQHRSWSVQLQVSLKTQTLYIVLTSELLLTSPGALLICFYKPFYTKAHFRKKCGNWWLLCLTVV